VTVSRPIGGVLCLPCGSGGHPSKRPTWGLLLSERTSRPCPTLGLAPGGVCRAARITPDAGALLPHRFTLTCAGMPVIGGLFSVALSCGSPRLAVSQHPALWSPDLPRPGPASGPSRGHPAGSPSPPVCQAQASRRYDVARSGPLIDFDGTHQRGRGAICHCRSVAERSHWRRIRDRGTGRA
jgi:hypothetical protein